VGMPRRKIGKGKPVERRGEKAKGKGEGGKLIF